MLVPISPHLEVCHPIKYSHLRKSQHCLSQVSWDLLQGSFPWPCHQNILFFWFLCPYSTLLFSCPLEQCNMIDLFMCGLSVSVVRCKFNEDKDLIRLFFWFLRLWNSDQHLLGIWQIPIENNTPRNDALDFTFKALGTSRLSKELPLRFLYT
jgi:hypothetical protein